MPTACRWSLCRAFSTWPLPERVATTDLFHDTAIVAQQRGASIYLLGATKAVVDQAVRRTRELYPDLKIAGYGSGYLRRDGDEERIIADINQAQPDILWLGLGAPAEQSFAARNRDKLHGVGLIKTSGGLFDFLSGKNTRAPPGCNGSGWNGPIESISSRAALPAAIS